MAAFKPVATAALIPPPTLPQSIPLEPSADVSKVCEECGANVSKTYRGQHPRCKLHRFSQFHNRDTFDEDMFDRVLSIETTAVEDEATRETLGLSLEDMQEYTLLWVAANTDNTESLGEVNGARFFRKSGLKVSVLRRIMQDADTDEPLGELNRNEFFTACKLVAHVQGGLKYNLEILSTPTVLPDFNRARAGRTNQATLSTYLGGKIKYDEVDPDQQASLGPAAELTDDMADNTQAHQGQPTVVLAPPGATTNNPIAQSVDTAAAPQVTDSISPKPRRKSSVEDLKDSVQAKDDEIALIMAQLAMMDQGGSADNIISKDQTPAHAAVADKTDGAEVVVAPRPPVATPKPPVANARAAKHAEPLENTGAGIERMPVSAVEGSDPAPALTTPPTPPVGITKPSIAKSRDGQQPINTEAAVQEAEDDVLSEDEEDEEDEGGDTEMDDFLAKMLALESKLDAATGNADAVPENTSAQQDGPAPPPPMATAKPRMRKKSQNSRRGSQRFTVIDGQLNNGAGNGTSDAGQYLEMAPDSHAIPEDSAVTDSSQYVDVVPRHHTRRGTMKSKPYASIYRESYLSGSDTEGWDSSGSDGDGNNFFLAESIVSVADSVVSLANENAGQYLEMAPDSTPEDNREDEAALRSKSPVSSGTGPQLVHANNTWATAAELLPSLQIVHRPNVVAKGHPKWVPDKQRKKCTNCRAAFTLRSRRKHHCRLCGEIFCHACSGGMVMISQLPAVYPDDGQEAHPYRCLDDGSGLKYRASPILTEPELEDSIVVRRHEIVYAAGAPEPHNGAEWMYVPDHGWLATKTSRGKLMFVADMREQDQLAKSLSSSKSRRENPIRVCDVCMAKETVRCYWKDGQIGSVNGAFVTLLSDPDDQMAVNVQFSDGSTASVDTQSLMMIESGETDIAEANDVSEVQLRHKFVPTAEGGKELTASNAEAFRPRSVLLRKSSKKKTETEANPPPPPPAQSDKVKVTPPAPPIRSSSLGTFESTPPTTLSNQAVTPPPPPPPPAHADQGIAQQIALSPPPPAQSEKRHVTPLAPLIRSSSLGTLETTPPPPPPAQAEENSSPATETHVRNSTVFSDSDTEGWDSSDSGGEGDYHQAHDKPASPATTKTPMSAEEEAEIKAFRVAEEILSTEQAYCESLRVVSEVFIPLLCGGRRAPIPNQSVVFINWAELLDFQLGVLEQIEHAMEKKPLMIGACLNGIAPYMKPVYSTYTGRFDKAQRTWHKMKTVKAVAEAVRKAHLDPRCSQLGLDAYLLEPIQRIPRYKMLLESYAKRRQPDHPDYKQAHEAVQKMDQVAKATNGSLADMENIETRVRLQRGLPRTFEFNVMLPGRELHKHGVLLEMLRKGPRPRRLYLFSDCMVKCSEAYHKPMQLSLEDMTIEQSTTAVVQNILGFGSAPIEGIDHFIHIRVHAEDFVIGFDDKAKYEAWFAAINQEMANAVDLNRERAKRMSSAGTPKEDAVYMFIEPSSETDDAGAAEEINPECSGKHLIAGLHQILQNAGTKPVTFLHVKQHLITTFGQDLYDGNKDQVREIMTDHVRGGAKQMSFGSPVGGADQQVQTPLLQGLRCP